MRLFQPLQDSFLSLLTALGRIGDALEQRNKTERERQDSKKEQQTPADVARVRDAVESIAKSQKAAHNPEHWYKDRTFMLSAIGVAVVIAYTSVTYQMWRDTNRNFVVNHRAWVGVSRPISITAINYGSAKNTATYVVTLKNYGPSVALHAYTATKVVTDITQIRARMNNACIEAVHGMNTPMQVKIVKPDKTEITDNGGEPGETLFPSDEPGKWYRDIAFDRTDTVFIVGCIAYRDEFGKERHTRFCNWTTLDANSKSLPIFLYPFIGYGDAD